MFDHEKYPKRDYLIIGGKKYVCNWPVVQFADSGIDFKVGEGSRRRSPKIVPDLFVCHWTGGENDIETLVRVLDTRELGVEFGLDAASVIWQFCDPMLIDTFDAGTVNKRSFGCEAVCYGFTGPGRDAPPPRGLARGTYQTVLHGKKRELAHFYPKQLEAYTALINCVTAAVPSIPRRVPTGIDGKLRTGTLRPAELARFKGVLGHFHVSESKSDPGDELFHYLMARGYR